MLKTVKGLKYPNWKIMQLKEESKFLKQKYTRKRI